MYLQDSYIDMVFIVTILDQWTCHHFIHSKFIQANKHEMHIDWMKQIVRMQVAKSHSSLCKVQALLVPYNCKQSWNLSKKTMMHHFKICAQLVLLSPSNYIQGHSLKDLSTKCSTSAIRTRCFTWSLLTPSKPKNFYKIHFWKFYIKCTLLWNGLLS